MDSDTRHEDAAMEAYYTCPVCGKEVKGRDMGYGICTSCEEQGYWMDPIGTIHQDGDDPAAAYE